MFAILLYIFKLYCTCIDSIIYAYNKKITPKSNFIKTIQFINKNSKLVPYYIFGHTIYMTRDETIAKEFMSHPRRSATSIFDGHTSLDALIDAIKLVHGKNFNLNDSVLSCDYEFTSKYHEIIKSIDTDMMHILVKKHVSNFLGNNVSNNAINLNTFCKHIISKIFLELFFDYDSDIDIDGVIVNSFDINSNINGRMASLLGKKYKYDIHLENDIIIKCCNCIIDKKPKIFEELTYDQQILMFYTLLFASHENTYDSLVYIIYDYVIKKRIEKKISVTKSITDYCPVFGVTRIIKNDFSYLDTNFKKGDIFGTYNEWMDNRFIFGIGPHKCPGKKIALILFRAIIYYIDHNYNVTDIFDTVSANEAIILKTNYMITKKIDNNLSIAVTKK